MVRSQLKLSIEQQKALTSYLNWLDRARKTGAIDEALKQYYKGENSLYRVSVNGDVVSLPILTKQNWVGLEGSLNDFVGGMEHSKTTSHHNETIEGVAQEMYVKQRRGGRNVEPEFFNTDSIIWNGSTYRIQNFHNKNDVSFTLNESDFYSYVSVQERLLRELHHTMQELNIEHPNEVHIERIESRLPRRNSIASSFDEIINWENYFHIAAPVCLLAVNRLGNSPEIFLVERSRDVLHEPESMSVAPAGEVTPDTGLGPDFQQAVVRELVEEFMGVPENHYRSVSDTNELERRVWAHVVAGQISIKRTGLAFSVDSPRPCFAGLVYVRDPDIGEWIKDKLQINWEFKRVAQHELPLKEVPSGMDTPSASTPGAFAFFEGLRSLEKMGVNTGLEPSIAQFE